MLPPPSAVTSGRDKKQRGRAAARTDTVCLQCKAFESDKTLAFAKIVDLQSFYREALKQQIQCVFVFSDSDFLFFQIFFFSVCGCRNLKSAPNNLVYVFKVIINP